MMLLFLSKIKNIAKPQKVRIGEVLVKKGVITKEQLEQALIAQKLSGQKLGMVLIQEGLINRKQLDQALTTQYWQNVTASVFLSAGTLAATAPQLAVAQTTIVPKLSEQKNIDRVQLNRQFPGLTNSLIARFPSGNDNVPVPVGLPALASNPNPTEANPLLGFLYPLNRPVSISQGYRGRTHQGRMEFAIDIPAAIGTPVYAMRAGKVVSIEDRFPDIGGGRENGAKFNYVWIEHDGGYRSAYVHLKQGFVSSVGIKVGDRVKAGQLIGFSGNSGWSTGPHLHVEVHRPRRGVFGQTVPFQFNLGSPSRVARQSN
ncbi:MAG: peptidoglycan DD-metalloendopeptidase family protein [Cyanosarcina radialis HA8281-LM2]|jgi:murein DD-endopeptidase MepM/ murein hydrolase activator NlpD|nr:peptidoglycan DD-metalloendopeptidase family protein [Cyanosarcina radialis HA8281-LM2]